MGKQWRPTHELFVTPIGAAPYKVLLMAEEGHDGGTLLYTREEWDADGVADLTRDADGTLRFQGQPGACRGNHTWELRDR